MCVGLLSLLRIAGNRFQFGANYTPWRFPLDVPPNEKNLSSPPLGESSAFKQYPTQKTRKHKKEKIGVGKIGGIVGGGTLLAASAVLFAVIRIRHSQKQMHNSSSGMDEWPSCSLEINMAGGEFFHGCFFPDTHCLQIKFCRTQHTKVKDIICYSHHMDLICSLFLMFPLFCQNISFF